MWSAVPFGLLAVAVLAAAVLLLAALALDRGETTLSVSKLGSGTGGKIRAQVFTTIQTSLAAVPEDVVWNAL